MNHLPFMGCGSESVGDQLHGGVDEESDKHSGSEDFGVWTLLLVQVPCSTHSQEVARVSSAVNDDDHDVYDLEGDEARYSFGYKMEAQVAVWVSQLEADTPKFSVLLTGRHLEWSFTCLLSSENM